MATYLRAAIGKASAFAPSTDSASKLKSHEQVGDSHTNVENEDGSLTASLTEDRDDDEAEEKAETPQFELKIDHQPPNNNQLDEKEQEGTEVEMLHDVDDVPTNHQPAKRKKSGAWAVVDVVLQCVSDGLGLNVGVSPPPANLPARLRVKSSSVVVVRCFRRSHADAAGPAESSGQVRIGDLLLSIDGEAVDTLAKLGRIMATVAADQFLMLRLLRYAYAHDDSVREEPTPTVTLSTKATVQPASAVITQQPDIAMLIRELVVKNQHLEEQLMASKLKQDEQRIQLDQLHTLYAKTQLDGSSSFLPLPKPLTRPVFNRRSTDSTTKGGTRSTAAARLIGSTASAANMELALKAERDRVTQAFAQQLETAVLKERATHDRELTARREAMEKKIEMLEYGLLQLLTQDADRHDRSPHVQALRHRVLHQTLHQDCLLCLLANECEHVEKTNEWAWRQSILQVIQEHRCRNQSEASETENAHHSSATQL